MANAAAAAPFIIEAALPGNVALIPETITRSIPSKAITEEYRARLRSGGTLKLKDTTFEIGELPDFGANRYALMALDVLELDNSTIVTNGHTLALVANVIKSNNSRIVAFRPEEKGDLRSQWPSRTSRGARSPWREGASGGQGGNGGAGGEGGEGGDGEGFCNGGPPGDRGPAGAATPPAAFQTTRLPSCPAAGPSSLHPC